MNNLRKYSIEMHYMIPLTPEESSEGNHSYSNPTWLAEHRSEPWTHPHSREFPKGYSYNYHLYGADFYRGREHCSNSKIFTNQFFGTPEHYGYNITEECDSGTFLTRADMFLPFWQRRITCLLSHLSTEIFDTLRPNYHQFFANH